MPLFVLAREAPPLVVASKIAQLPGREAGAHRASAPPRRVDRDHLGVPRPGEVVEGHHAQALRPLELAAHGGPQRRPAPAHFSREAVVRGHHGQQLPPDERRMV